MKALKIGVFFLAGAIIQTAFYFAEYLGIMAGYGGLLAVASFTSVIAVVLGNKAHEIAEKKMKMSPVVLTMCYVAGTLAVIAALYFILDTKYPYHDPDSTGLGNLPNLGRNISLVVLFFTIPSAAINAIVQVVLCVKRRIERR